MKPFYSAATALLIALLLTGLTGQSLFAQQKSIGNIFEANLRNFGAIRNNNTVTGYYFFYETEGKRKRDRVYTVSLLDQNLEQIGSKTIEGDRFLELREGVYNGNALALKFANLKEEAFTLRLLDKSGEEISSRKVDFGTFHDPRYQPAGGEGGMMGDQTLFSAPGKGFVHYTFDTNRGAMSPTYYTIHFLPDDGDRERTWDYQSTPNNVTWEMASFLAAGEEVLLSTVVKRQSLMSRDLEYHVLAIDLDNGEQLFEKSLEDDQYALMLTNAWLQDAAVRP
mgnify:CR=1 FL=1